MHPMTPKQSHDRIFGAGWPPLRDDRLCEWTGETQVAIRSVTIEGGLITVQQQGGFSTARIKLTLRATPHVVDAVSRFVDLNENREWSVSWDWFADALQDTGAITLAMRDALRDVTGASTVRRDMLSFSITIPTPY